MTILPPSVTLSTKIFLLAKNLIVYLVWVGLSTNKGIALSMKSFQVFEYEPTLLCCFGAGSISISATFYIIYLDYNIDMLISESRWNFLFLAVNSISWKERLHFFNDFFYSFFNIVIHTETNIIFDCEIVGEILPSSTYSQICGFWLSCLSLETQRGFLVLFIFLLFFTCDNVEYNLIVVYQIGFINLI